MLGRDFPGVEPGTFEARRLGMLALASGRPDLLRSGDTLNAGVGVGQVPFVLTGTIIVGSDPVMVSSGHKNRSTFRLQNITYLDNAGNESVNWVSTNGVTYKASGLNPIPGEQCRLKLAFGRPANANDMEADVGRIISITDSVQKGDVWLFAIGTAGSSVRYQIEEVIDYDLK